MVVERTPRVRKVVSSGTRKRTEESKDPVNAASWVVHWTSTADEEAQNEEPPLEMPNLRPYANRHQQLWWRAGDACSFDDRSHLDHDRSHLDHDGRGGRRRHLV